MPSEQKKQIGTVDITPTWSALLPVYLLVYETNPLKRSEIMQELTRMAGLADRYVASQRGDVCERCNIRKRENGDHHCESCGEKI